MQIFLGNGLGGFTVGQNVVINPQCNNIEITDLNKDGNLDLVLAGAGSENVGWSSSFPATSATGLATLP